MNPYRIQMAESLREQAAALRRLAVRARTHEGQSALLLLAQKYDAEGRRWNPESEKR